MSPTVASTLSRGKKKPNQKTHHHGEKTDLYTKTSPHFTGSIMQSTDKLTKSSLLTYEHRAILPSNFPKTPPQYPLEFITTTAGVI